MKVKSIVLSFFVTSLTLLSLTARAQPGQGHPPNDGGERSEQVEKFYIAYLTQELDFSTEEAQQFWPLFNAMEGEKKTLGDERKQIMKDLMDGKNHKASDVETALDRVHVIEVKLVDARRAFAQLLMSTFDAEMAVNFIEAQKGFRRAMLNAVNQREKNGGQGARRPGRGQR
jgi:hypothetical protein